jgi:hypothetical protein
MPHASHIGHMPLSRPNLLQADAISRLTPPPRSIHRLCLHPWSLLQTLSNSIEPSAVPLAISSHARIVSVRSAFSDPIALRSLRRLRHLPKLLRPQSVDSHPPSSPPSLEPSWTSIRRLSSSAGSAIIFRTFVDLDPSTPSLRWLCHCSNLLRLRHRIFSSQVPSRSSSANLLRRIRRLAASIRAFTDAIVRLRSTFSANQPWCSRKVNKT